MNCFDLFKMIFYVFDNEYDNNPNEELGNLCSSMNPFLFEGEGSAVEEVYEQFKKAYFDRFKNDCSLEEGYEFGKKYAKNTKVESAISAFDKISIEDWINAYKQL